MTTNKKPIKYQWSADAIHIFMAVCPRCGGMLNKWEDVIVCMACMAEEIERRNEETTISIGQC